MNKKEMKKLALLGLISGTMVCQGLHAADTNTKAAADTKAKSIEELNAQNVGYHLYTEDELLLELNDEGAKLFNSLSPEGKKLALEVASSRCNGTNSCKGLNACQTANNSCAGQGSCKGTGKCAMADKNLAVKLVHNKLAKERAGLGK